MRIGSNNYWLEHEPCISPLVDHLYPTGFGMRTVGCNHDPVWRTCLGMA